MNRTALIDLIQQKTPAGIVWQVVGELAGRIPGELPYTDHSKPYRSKEAAIGMARRWGQQLKFAGFDVTFSKAFD